MSAYTLEQLHEGTVQGFHSIFGNAWHRAGADIDAAKAAGQVFDGPVPPEVAHRIVGWTPVAFKLESLVDPDTMIPYDVPDRFRTVVCNPNSGNVINVAGDGYAVNLHNVMADAIQAALDAECDIAGAICLGDGAHLNISFKPRDTVRLGGFADGVIALVGYNSSLTGAISTSAQSSAKLAVCDNTMKSQRASAIRAVDIKRTRNSESRITASEIRTVLEIAFHDAECLVEDLERLAQIELSTDEFRRTMDLWRPLPDEDGRGKTLAEKDRATLARLYLNDARNVFGQNAAGLWQAYNTFQHWSTNKMTDRDRIQRQAQRVATGEAAVKDTQFLSVLAKVQPSVAKALVPA